MQKKVGAVIGASRDAIHSIQTAQKNGIYVVGLDGNPNAEGLKYVDEARIVDISNVELVKKELEAINPDFAIPIPIGRYLSTMGIVNQFLGLTGVKENAANWSTDKYLFHQKLHSAGLRECYAVLVAGEIENKDSIKYPVLFKPRYGSGSRDIYYMNDKNEFDIAYGKLREIDEDFILEQVVQGTEYSVDGAVIEGEFYLTLLRKKIITPLPARQPVSSFSIDYSDENKELMDRVIKHIEKAVRVLEYNDCLLNADIIINDNEVFIIEMAPRPSGHNLHDVFVPYATGVDLADEYIHFLKQEPFCFTPKKVEKLQIRFFDFENKHVVEIPEYEKLKEVLKEDLIYWNCNIEAGEYLNCVTNGHSIMGRGFFIIRGIDEDDLINKSSWVLEQFNLR